MCVSHCVCVCVCVYRSALQFRLIGGIQGTYELRCLLCACVSVKSLLQSNRKQWFLVVLAVCDYPGVP